MPRLTKRSLIAAALTANAVKPLPGTASALSFFPGWLTSELAPQLLALTAADAAVSVKRGKGSPLGLAVAGGTVAGLGYLIANARKTSGLVEASLREGLGTDYLDRLERTLDQADERTPVRELARPFHMRRREVKVERDISYTRGGSRARLDIYSPREGDLSDAPVLIQIHGGGWLIGDKKEQGQLLMGRMASLGWVCVAINYRLAGKHPWPAQIIDVKKAIAWTRENIASYGGDPSYVVVTGGSAGGHLAALAALTPNDPEYQPGFEDADTRLSACVPFYGVYDLAGISGTKASVGLRDRYLAPLVFKKKTAEALGEMERASPMTRINPDAPDFYVLHGEHDSLVSVWQARDFVKTLRAVSKGKVLYSELPGTQHAWEIFSSIRSNHTIRAVERFLEWHRLTRREATDLIPDELQGSGSTAR